MSAEKIFQSESVAFQFASVALFMVLYGVSWAVGSCFSVTFYVGMRGVSCWYAWCLSILTGFVGKEISEEEGENLLIPSSTMLWVHIWLKLCERRRNNCSR